MRVLPVKVTLLWFLCSCLLLTACATVEKSGDRVSPEGWSSSDPLSIPYDARQAQLAAGNLVINPSFENGRRDAGKTDEHFIPEGWQMVGDHVRTTTREASSGNRSVKIARARANEGDDAEGVISDYIAVIPGNYYFSYHIKLKNITNNKSRLGVQLYDAVVIKVLFFDADKQPIESGARNPVSRSLIDNSNKSYSFSNY